MSRLRQIPVEALVLGLLALAGCAARQAHEAPADSAARLPSSAGATPNFVVILVDDLRFDETGAGGHPYVETPNIDRLAREGATFTHAFHAVPLCSPNRASLLTGQFPSRHGIIDNVARSQASHHLETFPRALQAHGYETGFLGKWHMGNDPTPRPGFEYWAAIPGQGRIIDPVLFEDGAPHRIDGYITDILTDRAVAFIERERDRPFFLFIGEKAIHPDAIQLDDGSVDKSQPMDFIPAPRHAGRYDGRVFPRRPNVPRDWTEVGSSALRRALGLRATEEIARDFPAAFLDSGTSETTIRRRAEMLLAVDEGVGRILSALEERGILERTVVIFTSDNGYFFGEHGLSVERRMPYDEGIRSPLLIRYPPLVSAGSRFDQMTLSVDLAPTVLELAGAPVGDHVQGRSLVPVLRGEAEDWRESVLIEFYTYENPFPWLVDMDYRAIRTDRYKYVHWMRHEPELYDLEADPYEMVNLAGEPAMAEVAAALRAELGRWVLEAMGL